MPPHCQDHIKITDLLPDMSKLLVVLQKDVEYLRRDQEIILARIGKHIEDAEKEGGRHERLTKAEAEIMDLKRQRADDLIAQRWFMGGAGIIGGLIGAGAPEAITCFARAIGLIH